MRRVLWLDGACVAAIGAGLLLASRPARAQVPAPTNATSRAVATAIAAAWHVAPGRIRLEWLGRYDSVAAATPLSVRPAGSATGSAWLVTLSAEQRAHRVRAGVMIAEPHAAHDLVRGTTLEDSDIAQDSVVRWGAPPAPSQQARAGWVTHSAVLAGAWLRPPAVTPPAAVHTGDTVRVIWRGGAVVASARGRAANSAATGEAVAVHLDNGQRIEGRVVRAGRVIIP